MLTSDEKWELLERIIREGATMRENSMSISLYEVEYPTASQGVLRIFLCNGDGGAEGITLSECTQIAKILSEHPQIDELAPGESTIEVSSPGINRKLTRPFHFKGAVGERVRVSVLVTREGTSQRETFSGILREVTPLIESKAPASGELILKVEVEEKRNKENGKKRGAKRDEKDMPSLIREISLSQVTQAKVDYVFSK